MKKKIIAGLSIFALMFFFGGIYVVMTTENTIYDLHRLSQLHRTVALRKDLLLGIKKNQSDVMLRRAHFARKDIPAENGPLVIVKKCFACHHPSRPLAVISSLKNQLETYQALTDSVFQAFPGSVISESRARSALRLGDELMGRVERIISVTSANLQVQEREMLRKINQRKAILFALVTIGPFFAVGLAFVLIQGLTSPVRSLLDATRRLKAGDLDYRITTLKDEFAELASSLNEMAASLKGQMQEMQRTEQLKACGEMAAGLAHEIRNPLAGMKVSIEVLLAELDLEEKDRDVLSKIIEQIRNMELLIKNLLNYARPVAAQMTKVDVNRILANTAYFIEKHPSFSSGGPQKRIIKEFAAGLPEAVADPQQLQQVFLNLFLNAADALPEGGTITARTAHERIKNAIVIELEDTGKGIPPELRERIFQPFFTTKRKGTGLGLAVSKRLVEENGGTITVTDNNAGGATFRIMLPVSGGTEEPT